jgi:hypothetical protein
MTNLTLIVLYFSLIIFLASVQGQGNGTRCTVQGKSSKCKFDPSQLNLATGSVMELLDKRGTKVKCKKLVTKNGWYGGECDNNARDANFIQRRNRNGSTKVFGTIRIGTDICHIQPNGAGVDEMTCTPEADFPPEDDGLEPPTDGEEDYEARVRKMHVGFNPNFSDNSTYSVRGGANARHRKLPYDDSGANIDIMVLWTKEAECKNSRLPTGCNLTTTTESNMRGLIDLAVAETNTAYSLSGMLSSLRLVHAYRENNFEETTTFNYETTLRSLSDTEDGEFDNVHELRALYGADMVQMIVGTYMRNKSC